MKEALATTFTGMVTLLTAAALSAFLMGSFAVETPAPEMLNAMNVALLAEEKGIETVTTVQMREIVQTGSHLILDARDASEYDKGHIPAAMSVPVRQFEESFPMIAPMLELDTPVAVYCSGPLCDDALQLIDRMREAGFTGAVLYPEGMEGWE